MVAVLCAVAACGQKGPPLPPLHLVPAAVTELSARRVEDRVRLRFVLPTANVNGPGRLDLDHVEIYAITVAGGVTPPNRMLLDKERLVGRIEVRPAPIEGEPPVTDDKRPGPGEAVVFEETLTPAALTPVAMPVAAPLAKPAGAATTPATTAVPADKNQEAAAAAAGTTPAAGGSPLGGAPAAPSATPPSTAPATPPATTAQPTTAAAPPAAAQPAPTGEATAAKPGAPAQAPAGASAAPATAVAAPPPPPVRVYIARGVTRSGRTGAPSTRLGMPIVPLPGEPTAVAARYTETGVVIGWTPSERAPAAQFNVFREGDAVQPINPAPLKEPTFQIADAPLGEEQCYRVRSVGGADTILFEGPLSEPTCVTPKDTFAPAAPQRLNAVPTPGQISLIWDANTEKDLAGYLVLRGEGPNGPLAAITPAPIKETSYRDATVKPGVRYIYAIVAVDTATPPNTSPQSERVEETAR